MKFNSFDFFNINAENNDSKDYNADKNFNNIGN